ncbi:MAG: TRAP transporter large permease subunit [Rhodospirillaceae bacterium]|nr:TRAP transporter large permease subunit [Rhodospirillaceae bacterium]
MTALTILAIMMVLLFIGVPVAFALGGLGLVMLVFAGMSPLIVPQGLYSLADSFVLLSVPLFLLMSNMLWKGGAGKSLFAAVQSWVGHWPGGLGIATVLSCAVFAAISGSSVACAATIGTVAIGEMTQRGYDKPFVYGLLAAGGTLGILIPPSIPMIVYCVLTDDSISDMFLAGVGPGMALCALFIAYSFLYGKFGKGCVRAPRASWSERRVATLQALPVLGIAVVVIGSIYLGICTPTESAAIGFIAALIVVGVRRSLSWTGLSEAVMESMRTTVTIFLIMAGATVFGKAITLYQIPQDVAQTVSDNITSVGPFVFVVCVVLLIMGFFLESMSMLMIMMPVLHPALIDMGIDTIWFGVLFMIMIECALVTPPVGLNLYVIQAVAKSPIGLVIKGVWPFILMLFFVLVCTYFMPGLALFIPFRL